MLLLLKLLALVLLFYLPGWLACSFFLRKTKDAERALLEISTSVLVTGLIALVLAHIGIFSITLVCTLSAAACLLLLLFNRKKTIAFPSKWLAVFAAIFLLLLFVKPHEALLGGVDPGVYLATGINIAQTGKIMMHDDAVRELHTIRSFYDIREEPEYAYYGWELPGFYVTNPEKGEITPQFYYLYPAWIAIFYSLFGINGAIFTTLLFALLAMLAFFLFTKEIFNTKIAAVAALLLALNFAQIWYSLNANSEILMQFFMFLALYSLYRYSEENSAFFGALAAFATGSGLLTRIEFVFIIPILLAYIIYLRMKQKITLRYFMLPFAALLAYSFIIAFKVSRPYTLITYVGILGNPKNWSFTTSTLPLWFVLFAALILFLILKTIKIKDITVTDRQKLYAAFAAWLLITALYFFSTRFLENSSANLSTLSWYVTPIGFFIGMLGILIMFWDKKGKHWLMLAFFIVYFGLFSLEAIISKRHPWWIRRFVPVVIPVLLIGISYFSLENKIFKNKTAQKAFAAACILGVGAMSVLMSMYIFKTNDFDGLTAELSKLNDAIQEPAIVLYFLEGHSHKFATPLKYIFGRTVIKVQNRDTAVFEKIRELGKNNTIYLLSPTPEVRKQFGKSFALNLHYTSTVRWKSINDQKQWKSALGKFYYLPLDPGARRYELSLYTIAPKQNVFANSTYKLP